MLSSLIFSVLIGVFSIGFKQTADVFVIGFVLSLLLLGIIKLIQIYANNQQLITTMSHSLQSMQLEIQNKEQTISVLERRLEVESMLERQNICALSDADSDAMTDCNEDDEIRFEGLHNIIFICARIGFCFVKITQWFFRKYI